MLHFLSRHICQKEFFASRTENTVAPDICVATSTLSFALIHSLISGLAFLCAATTEETQSVGSVTGVMIPMLCMHLSSVLTHSRIVTGMQWAGRITGCMLGSTVICDWEFSELITEQVFVLCENQSLLPSCGELMDIWTHFGNSHVHTCTKS